MKNRLSPLMVGVLTVVCLVAGTPGNPRTARIDPYKNFSFRVEIGGERAGGFSEVSGLAVEIQPVEYRSGDENVVRKLPGVAKYNNITLKRGYISNSALFEWINSARSGSEALERRDVNILVFDQAGEPINSFNLSSCFPISWKLSPLTAEDQVPLTEELILACDLLDIE